MLFEKVHTIWNYWDGIRSGVADHAGAPHYFECPFDVNADDYSGHFHLYLVNDTFLRCALRNWEIFRAWEARFHSGQETHQTHPGHRGLNAEYNELDDWLNREIQFLSPLPDRYKPTFRTVAGQEHLPIGIFREQEVMWSKV